MKFRFTLTKDAAEAKQLIEYGWNASVIASALTILLIIAAEFGIAKYEYLELYDLWSLVDVAIVLSLGYGLKYRTSRICGIILLFLFIYHGIVNYSVTGKPAILSLIYVFFSYQGVIGVFSYRRIVPAKKIKKIILVFGVSLSSIMVGLCCFNVIFLLYGLPDGIIQGNKLKKSLYDDLSSYVQLSYGEEIKFFYTNNLFDFTQNTYLLTNLRLIIFDGASEGSFSMDFDQIMELDFIPAESWYDYSYITFKTDNEDNAITFPNFNGKNNLEFFNRLTELTEKKSEATNDDFVNMPYFLNQLRGLHPHKLGENLDQMRLEQLDMSVGKKNRRRSLIIDSFKWK